MAIPFRSKSHSAIYSNLIDRCSWKNGETRAVMYLLALVCKSEKEVEQCFNFEENCIIRSGLSQSWQTSRSISAIKLAFNLWDGYDDRCNVYSLFDTELDKYFLAAIVLRYDI